MRSAVCTNIDVDPRGSARQAAGYIVVRRYHIIWYR